MIAFGHNIHFVDEPEIDDGVVDKSLMGIRVIHIPSDTFIEHAIYTTPTIELSGQKVRFCSLVSLNGLGEGDSWAMEVVGRMRLVWDGHKRLITYEKEDGFEASILRYWVLHTFLPLVFQLEGRYHIIHVGCVAIEGEAVIFAAPSYGGKSTLVEYFLHQGHGLLSDDSLGVVATPNGYDAIPAYPFRRPYRANERLGEYSDSFVKYPMRIGAIYTLHEVSKDTPVVIRQLQGVEKFQAFGASAFVKFDFLKKANFEFLSKMAHTCRLYSLDVPRDIQRLPEVYREIIAHRHRNF